HQLSRHRHRARRHYQWDHRRLESPHRDHRPARHAGRRHDGDPGARSHRRRSRRGRVPRHGDDHSRPCAGHDEEGHDPTADQGRRPHVRLRPPLRRDVRLLDNRQLRRGRVPHSRRQVMKAKWALVVAAAVVMSWAAQAAAQFPPRGGGPPPTPRAAAPIDLTGVWLSIVNEDWRWRMITAPRGDFPGLPLSPAGRAIAMAWDPKTDGSCKAFGAAAVMRMPTRVRISWADDTTLKLETDNGQQTRLLHFGAGPGPGAPAVQGACAATAQRTLAPQHL